MEKKKYYAGIGSRETPKELIPEIQSISTTLYGEGYILRSGGAPGADTFFENLIPQSGKEIYLPWKGFNDNTSSLYEITPESLKMAESYHPGWSRLSTGAKKLMARNCFQVLGFDLKTPVEFIVCWTPEGKIAGGTGQAMRIAKRFDIPVYNLYHNDCGRKIRDHILRSL